MNTKTLAFGDMPGSKTQSRISRQPWKDCEVQIDCSCEYLAHCKVVDCVKMKLNISLPTTGYQKLIDIDNECKFHALYEKFMAMEVATDTLGEEWKAYVVLNSDWDDKQGFPMKQGILTHELYRNLALVLLDVISDQKYTFYYVNVVNLEYFGYFMKNSDSYTAVQSNK
ncbi:hypothetical protein STEG23_020412, partial [Scotinomys teguina]